MHFRQLEMAAFNAWPAKEQIESSHMVLRFADGYTKRANSANVLTLENCNYVDLIEQVERYFTKKQLPSIFRIPSFVDAIDFEQCLQDKGYAYQDKSYVYDLDLINIGSPKASLKNIEVTVKDADAWMQSFCYLNDSSLTAHQAHLDIILNIKDQMYPIVLRVDGEEVACGLAVLHQGYLGVFDVLTAKNHRSKGYAHDVLQAMLAFGIENQATHSYLQVVANNTPAIRLYEKLGYKRAYEYGYRIKHL